MQAIDIVTATEIKERLQDYQALTLTLWGEARGLSDEAKFAVGCTIKNRLKIHFRGARTWKDVCLSRLQYSCWFAVGGPKNYQAVLQAALIMLEEHSDSWPKSLKACANVAKRLLVEDDADVTDGATHYYLEGTPQPSWAKPPAILTLELGGHLFFRNVK